MEVEPDEAYYTVRRLAVDAALMFSNAEIINNAVRGEEREVRHAGFALRDALAYRFDSVLYHLERVQRVQLAAEVRLHSDPLLMRDSHDFLRAVIREERIVFDDMVFNLVAFYDYLGHFCTMLLQAESQEKRRWDKAYKWAKHANAGGSRGNPVHGTRAGVAIVTADERWVRRLTAFRSDVIHYGSDKLRGGVQFSFTQAEAAGTFTPDHSIAPEVPIGFRRVLKLWSSEEKVTIVVAAKALANEAFKDAVEILKGVVKDLEERIPDIPEGIVLREPVMFRTADGA